MVSEYTGLNFNEIKELDCFEFWQYAVDAFIERKNSTENGRKYLKNAYYNQQSEPDRIALRKQIGD